MSQRDEARSMGMAQRFSSIMPLFAAAATTTCFDGTSPAKGKTVLLIWCQVASRLDYSLATGHLAYHIHEARRDYVIFTQAFHNQIMFG